jgi:hypothetical protein
MKKLRNNSCGSGLYIYIYIYISHVEKLRNILCECRLWEKYIRQSIHKLILYFLVSFEKNIKKKSGLTRLCQVTRVLNWPSRSPRFDWANYKFRFFLCEIKPRPQAYVKSSQGPKSQVNLPGRARFHSNAWHTSCMDDILKCN